MPARRAVTAASLSFTALVLGGCLLAVDARADDAKPAPNQEQLETWLAEKPASADVSKTPEAPEAPPPPPRRHGFTVESSIGALTQIGNLRHVSPSAPWFHAAFGYEFTKNLTLLAQTDITLASTSLASPPPEPRSYTLFGFSAAGRFTLPIGPVLGVFAQAEAGLAQVSNDILSTYGYNDANSLEPYFGGMLGIEWYQVSPHYALGARAGLRSYGALLDRSLGGDAALAWLGAVTLRYTF
jgi:hypothetical protein